MKGCPREFRVAVIVYVTSGGEEDKARGLGAWADAGQYCGRTRDPRSSKKSNHMEMGKTPTFARSGAPLPLSSKRRPFHLDRRGHTRCERRRVTSQTEPSWSNAARVSPLRRAANYDPNVTHHFPCNGIKQALMDTRITVQPLLSSIHSGLLTGLHEPYDHNSQRFITIPLPSSHPRNLC